MSRLRVCTCIILQLAIIALLGACFSSESYSVSNTASNKAIDSKVKLRFINSWGGVDSKADMLKYVLNKFMERNTEIEVVNESIFGDEFLPKIKTDFASGYAPDVFGLWPGSDIKALVEAGKIADLTGVLLEDKRWMDSFKTSMWKYTKYDGRIYGLPVETVFEGIFINRDLFDKYGIKIPRTYDELKTGIMLFKKNGIVPIAYNSSAEGTYLYQNIIASIAGKEGVEQPFEGRRVKTSYIRAMDIMRELYRMGAFPEDAFTINSKERNDLFKNKKAAMIAQGSWFIGEFEGNDEDVDIIPFPKMDKHKNSKYSILYGLGCGTFYMSKTAWDTDKKRQASIKLLKALTSQETSSLFAARTGMLSNIKIDDSTISYSKLVKRGKQFLSGAYELAVIPDHIIDRSIWEEIVVKKFPYVLEGKIEADDVWDEVIKKNKG